MKMKERTNGALLRRAEQAIAHGALTNSKRPQGFVNGVYPTHLAKGQGAHVYDMNGNKYVDFICGLGSNLLGYANEEITEAITKQARLGVTLSLGTELEVKVAEQVKVLFPFIERMRFLKTGSEATTAALIIARSYAGRSEVLSDGYHGFHPEFVSLTEPADGVPPPTFISSFTSLDDIGQNTAARIV